MSNGIVDLVAEIERKRADLPRFAVVPATLIAAWRLTGTTTIEVAINDHAVQRRSIMQWDEARWFISITERDCARVGVDTGDVVRLRLQQASTALPDELRQLLDTDPAARQTWDGLTAAQQRAVRENVLAAKQPATRQRRARKALGVG